ncbi:putative ABC exporter domain-containing protein [Desulfitobacterium sp. Sab5]|uniref:putative ABC exporter domain-containing protein n=1 Tax=Desulfitobacterium nosdiversum TaxID=3375356 RepID=UPI003CFA3AEF
MHDYQVLLRYDLIKLKNYFVEIRHNPKKLVGYFLFLAWVILVMMPSILGRRGQKMNELPINIQEYILGGYSLVIIVLLFLAFFSALNRLSYSFQMGDVNLLFPSPLEPNRILFWSLIKKIPGTLAKAILPLLFLTPTLFNIGLKTQGIILVYLSIVSAALIVTPLSFLVFLFSVRYGQRVWVSLMLFVSALWMAGSWLWVVRKHLFSLGVLLGYRAGGVSNFPILGWIIQLASAAFFGITFWTWLALCGIILTLFLVNIALFKLAEDYYEDVEGYTETMANIREAKRKGKVQGLYWGRTAENSESKLRWRRFIRRNVIVQGNYPEGWAFLYKQMVKYSRTSITPYFGFVTFLSGLAGILYGLIALHKGTESVFFLLYGMNGVIAYLMFFRTFAGPTSEELSLPYIYTLPGTFLKKGLAINILPTLRFILNILLLNLSYLLIVQRIYSSASLWFGALFSLLLVTSFYFAQSNTLILGYVILPSSLERKLFYPLLIFSEVLLIGVPAFVIAGIVGLLTKNIWATGTAVIVSNIGVGFLILLLSDTIFSHLEMREYN